MSWKDIDAIQSCSSSP